ncbi:endonuclease/exonuclease/phosphatase family protein [Leptolyngbya sp. FACHB-711]|uniref:endonuclease/exonuclease/phosphatase family protein n=1 Tax=unclassified Leptolyngbya TaxID=2650499 RepID=UPI0016842231|nr:endonuclease/exonuclease/phosphatase family protein [Leptolyngbya sp. FACHB-711]MBD1852034.1 endonuclease/exonuclease/phosphatase family protein [Cyanobacteria bacterium FACHB-502]MBD2023004.1 endonuclease/exonuclease/phosphatase family protein [Leptolyngbya sp. FACHB-711]
MRHSFRVGTFNLYNLLLPNIPYYENRRYSIAEYERKKQWIAAQLNRMQADIVGFQEVFHQEALEEVLTGIPTYEGAALITGDPNGEKPRVALVSRFPVLRYEVIDRFPAAARFDLEDILIPLDRFARPVIQAEVAITNSLVCTVIVVHLKSKRPVISEGKDRHDPIEIVKGQTRALIQRAAEAIALRVLLVEVLQKTRHPVILMGDINDGDRAVTSRLISGDPPDPDWQHEYKEAVWDVLLYSAKEIQARQTRGDFYYTHIHDAHYESLDHILVSQEFMLQNPRHIGHVKYVSVLNDHLMDKSLMDHPVEVWKSDHGQVVAQIELRN